MAGKKTTKRKFRKGRTKKRSRKTFAKRVGAIINKGRETKEVYNNLAQTSFNSGIDSAGDVIRILPNMANGLGEAQRIGNQVQALSLTVKGAIIYNPSAGQFGTYSNTRLGIRMMIVQPKAYSSYDAIQANATTWLPQLLRKGLTQTAFTGVLDDLWAPINTEAITKYYDKVFMMTSPLQSTAVGYTEFLGSTKLFSKTFKFKGAGKVLRYDPDFNANILPTNYAPCIIIGYTHMDGSAPDTLSTAIQMNFTSFLNYKDA